jgi:hypothetical protein
MRPEAGVANPGQPSTSRGTTALYCETVTRFEPSCPRRQALHARFARVVLLARTGLAAPAIAYEIEVMVMNQRPAGCTDSV